MAPRSSGAPRRLEEERLLAYDLLPAIRLSGLDPGALQGDTDHPNAAGHDWIGRALCDRIRADENVVFPSLR